MNKETNIKCFFIALVAIIVLLWGIFILNANMDIGIRIDLVMMIMVVFTIANAMWILFAGMSLVMNFNTYTAQQKWQLGGMLLLASVNLTAWVLLPYLGRVIPALFQN